MSNPSPRKSQIHELRRKKERKLQRLMSAVDWSRRKAKKALKNVKKEKDGNKST